MGLIGARKTIAPKSIGLYAASATYTNATDWDDFQNRESTFFGSIKKQIQEKSMPLMMNLGSDFLNMSWKNQQSQEIRLLLISI